MTDSAFSACINKISGAKLTAMASCYADFSHNYDCLAAAKKFDAAIVKFSSAAKDIAWANSIIDFLSVKLAADVQKLVKEGATAENLRVQAKGIIAKQAADEEKARIEAAKNMDAKIDEALAGERDLQWCKRVESVYKAYDAFTATVKSLCKRAAALKSACDDVPAVREAIALDDKIYALCGGKSAAGEDYFVKVDKLKAEYDKASAKVKPLCKRKGDLDRAVDDAYRARKKAADALDTEYKRVNVKSCTKQSIADGKAFIAKWGTAAKTVKSLCAYANDKQVAALSAFFASEEKRIAKEEGDRARLEAEVKNWDDKILATCGYALSKSTADRAAGEDYFVKVDKLKAEFDKASASVKSLCKRRGDLDRAVEDAYRARKKSAEALDTEFKRVRVKPSTRQLIADGKSFIAKWGTAPKTVKSLCAYADDRQVAALSPFFVSEEKRIAKEEAERARLEAEARERERKRREAEERARQKAALDNDINVSYQKATRGDAEAMYKLAGYYFTGTGVTRSYNEAFNWYEKAAKKGHAGAMEKLGDCYYNGYGVEKSYSKAEKCYKKASKM